MIRDFNPATDTDAIVTVFTDASLQAHAFLGETRIHDFARQVRDLYIPMADTRVFEQDGHVVGFISVIEGKEVGGFFVTPTHAGNGIGQALMHDAVARFGTLELSVFEENPIGRKFYEAFGFEEIGRQTTPEIGAPEIRLKYTAV
ncbi:MAG: GNAT family N-acetyltransferase [Shimia sp.]|uniref:GNAT family N-acetyltransferase n=1 Tax=Shimia sp. TaxID=1954381 RepID=UPI00405A336B